MKKYRSLQVITSIVAFVSLLVDYFVTNELHIEGIFLFVAGGLLSINLLRQLNQKIWANVYWGVVVDTSFITFLIYYSFILLVLFFGYGFTGRRIHPIWVALALSCVILLSLSLLDILNIVRGKMYSKICDVSKHNK